MEDAEEIMPVRTRPNYLGGRQGGRPHPVPSVGQDAYHKPPATASLPEDVIVLEDDPTPARPSAGALFTTLTCDAPRALHTAPSRNACNIPFACRWAWMNHCGFQQFIKLVCGVRFPGRDSLPTDCRLQECLMGIAKIVMSLHLLSSKASSIWEGNHLTTFACVTSMYCTALVFKAAVRC